jgi:hypothetical protein
MSSPDFCNTARKLDEVQQLACEQLGPQAVHLLAWAWQRRAVLDLTTTDLVESVEPAWQGVAQTLFSAWDLAVRASSAVENGRVLCARTWPYIGPFRLGCWHCWLFGIITE